MGSRLGTLDIGAGRGQEPLDWILRLASLRPSDKGDLGSKLGPEMNPDLRLPKATCLFFAQLVRKLPSPGLHCGMAWHRAEGRRPPPISPSS